MASLSELCAAPPSKMIRQIWNPLGTNYGSLRTGLEDAPKQLRGGMADFPDGLGALLKTERTKRGLSLKQAGDIAAVDVASIIRAERQPRRMHAETLGKILLMAGEWGLL